MNEYNLRITDIDWEEGNRYEANTGIVYVVKGFEFINEIDDGDICQEYDLASIAKLAFKIVVDWSKVPIDAKILVRDSVEREWVPRHFAKYKNKRVFAFADGKTSHTTNYLNAMWQYAKLAEGEDE